MRSDAGRSPAAPQASPAEAALAVVDVCKSFGHVQALTDVSLSAYPGQVLALFGDNGAGKSTLMKIMCGALQPDTGTIRVGDYEAPGLSIQRAQSLGIQAVYQDLSLAPHLMVLENMFLGHELYRSRWPGFLHVLDRRRMAMETVEALERISIRLPSVHVPVMKLSGGQRQAVAVARAVRWARRAVLMDEPTAALGRVQSDLVVDTIRATARANLAVVVVSHDIPRMLEVADQVAVMRHGRIVAHGSAADFTLARIVGLMVGEESRTAPRDER
ncbi:MAG TPA: ATP-binding cassette domain-containing protein [Candidatus Dormibacteraeota bacterium]|nr:ATP-binding cassette domain-containing protein [Candidatus Dormibacteraeota bacterium]